MDDAESTFSEVVEAGLQSSTHRYDVPDTDMVNSSPDGTVNNFILICRLCTLSIYRTNG